MDKFYHFTTLDNLYGILSSGYINKYSTHSNYPNIKFISLTDDELMLYLNNDRKYSNHNVRIAIELDDRELIKVLYNIDFLRDNFNIAVHLFTDEDVLLEYLYEEEFDKSDFSFLEKESEYLLDRNIKLDEIKNITFIKDRQYKKFKSGYDLDELVELVIEKEIHFNICDYWVV